MRPPLRHFAFLILLLLSQFSLAQKIVVFQSDFGLKDGAVAAMKGVAMGVSGELKLYDLTHEIPAYNIWEASYRLVQTAPYWPAGTVFVSVVDPGVGTTRKSVVMRSKSGHYFVTPDNGTLTLVAEQLGVKEVREIDEAVNRRKNSNESYTFHGRDVYAYTAARLAAGAIRYEQVGKSLGSNVVRIAYQKPDFKAGVIHGGIPVLDVQYGNIWTNIDKATFANLGVAVGDNLKIRIFRNDSLIHSGTMKYVNTFGDVPEGNDVGYFNSLLNFSLGINMGSFAEKYHVQSGSEWRVELSK